MRCASFTVDVDRDVNLPLKGRTEGTSREVGGVTDPRFTSSSEGLLMLFDLLGELEIRATFFIEAETLQHMSTQMDVRDLFRGHEVSCHGLAHEDYTGKDTGATMSEEEILSSIQCSIRDTTEVLGRPPTGFRAPYLHLNDEVVNAVLELGFRYDSSIEKGLSQGSVGPYMLDKGLQEVPVTYGRDARGKKISSYLWPMHEGKRPVDDYRGLIDQFNDGLLVLATHTWHIVETYERRLTGPEIERNLLNVREVLTHAMSTGVEFMTIEAYVGKG